MATLRRLTAPAIGDYVFASRWGDRSPLDPWAVGWITDIVFYLDRKAGYRVIISDRPSGGHPIYRPFKYRHCWRLITDGKWLLDAYTDLCNGGVSTAPSWAALGYKPPTEIDIRELV